MYEILRYCVKLRNYTLQHRLFPNVKLMFCTQVTKMLPKTFYGKLFLRKIWKIIRYYVTF